MHEVMTPDEVAALLKIHVKTVYRLARQGVLPGRQIGRHWRFSRAEVLALVSRHPDGLDGKPSGAAPARRPLTARRADAP